MNLSLFRSKLMLLMACFSTMKAWMEDSDIFGWDGMGFVGTFLKGVGDCFGYLWFLLGRRRGGMGPI